MALKSLITWSHVEILLGAEKGTRLITYGTNPFRYPPDIAIHPQNTH